VNPVAVGPVPAAAPARGTAPIAPPVAELHRSFRPASAAGPPPGSPAARRELARPPALPGALRELDQARARLDHLIAQARQGRSFSPQELLGLQADAHRFAQTVELATRTVESGVQGLRQALHAQV
jgi:hypothetical protein